MNKHAKAQALAQQQNPSWSFLECKFLLPINLFVLVQLLNIGILKLMPLNIAFNELGAAFTNGLRLFLAMLQLVVVLNFGLVLFLLLSCGALKPPEPNIPMLSEKSLPARKFRLWKWWNARGAPLVKVSNHGLTFAFDHFEKPSNSLITILLQLRMTFSQESFLGQDM